MSDPQSLRILLVDDEEVIQRAIGGHLRKAGHAVAEASDGRTALKQIREQEYDLALVDIRMPGMDGLAVMAEVQEMRPHLPCIIITGHAELETAIEALRRGAADFLVKPIKLLELEAVFERVLRVRQLLQEKLRLRETLRAVQTAEDRRTGRSTFVGVSAATESVRAEIQRAVRTQCRTILITGETGTGKEVVARELHALAGPEESPFIAVNCPSLPDSLAENELFGHTKGAFTGAAEDRPGYFELADGGTLFLDEVSELSAAAQATLLRAVETRTFRRVGGGPERTVDVRIIAATNAPLADLAEDGRFRRDLFYRLQVYEIRLRPLRERREDIAPLAEHFLARYAETRGLALGGLNGEARALLRGYDYPGNARELQNIIERAAMLCGSGPVRPEHSQSVNPRR